jgi:cysteine desulfurase
LKAHGVEVQLLPINPNGIVVVDELKKLINQNTVLVSVMYANNEIGTIQPIREIAKIIREKRKTLWGARKEQVMYPYFHTDACQATNYLNVNVVQLGVDLLTINAAKIYGPKGVGLLYARRGVSLSPVIVGGGQEHGLRAGTENVPLIIGFARALSVAQEIRELERARLFDLREQLLTGIRSAYPNVIVNGDMDHRLPNNLNISIANIDHEHAVIALDALGIATSTKSACNELDAEISHVLHALREAEGDLSLPQSGIRLSLGRTTTTDDIKRTTEAFEQIRSQLTPLL